ncbi:MAG: hypothetical protein ACQKBV_04810 [Puniceicoccales bacterium]
MFWVLRTGSPWSDLPDFFGPWKSVHTASVAGAGRACGLASWGVCANASPTPSGS